MIISLDIQLINTFVSLFFFSVIDNHQPTIQPTSSSLSLSFEKNDSLPIPLKKNS